MTERDASPPPPNNFMLLSNSIAWDFTGRCCRKSRLSKRLTLAFGWSGRNGLELGLDRVVVSLNVFYCGNLASSGSVATRLCVQLLGPVLFCPFSLRLCGSSPRSALDLHSRLTDNCGTVGSRECECECECGWLFVSTWPCDEPASCHRL